jgi:tight adherence protein B
MLAFVASLFVFLAIVTGAVALFTSRQFAYAGSDRRLRLLRQRNEGAAGAAAGPAFKRAYSSIPTLRRFLSDSTWADKTARQLQEANLQIRVGEYILMRVLIAALFFFIPALILRFNLLGIVLGILAGGVAYLIPPLYLSRLRKQRAKRIEGQLVELAPMLASSLRSGFAMQQGLELAARQMEPPISDELQLLINDVNLGSTTEQALLDMGARVRSTDVDMFITAILVQRTTGGNLAEILDQLADTLRDRERVRGDLNTLTAQQRLTGYILSVYPAAVGLLLLVLLPDMWSKMFTELAGQIMLGIALGLQLIGFLAIRRVMDIEI